MKKIWFILIAVLMLVGCNNSIGSMEPEVPDNTRTITIVNNTEWVIDVSAGTLIPETFGEYVLTAEDKTKTYDFFPAIYLNFFWF